MNEKLSMQNLERKSVEEVRQSARKPIILVLENIRSGLNVGSIFRSADAFLIEKIICSGYTCTPPHREVLKSALGATETVPWVFEPDSLKVIAELKTLGYRCLAVEQTTNSMKLHRFTPQADEKLALILGNEVQGVSQECIDLCGESLEIAQYGSKHSLNVAVCAGIVLHTIIHQTVDAKN